MNNNTDQLYYIWADYQNGNGWHSAKIPLTVHQAIDKVTRFKSYSKLFNKKSNTEYMILPINETPRGY